MAVQHWTREQTLAALNLYCRTPFGRLHARNPDIIALAAQIGRTPDALAMKCCNLASLDPLHQARGVQGLSGASRLDREIWNEFHADPEALGFESELAIAEMTGNEPRTAEDVEWEDVAGLDRSAMVRVRVNQHLFRAMILVGYGERCAVCRLPLPSLLVASHIVPWSVDPAQRMNPRNGICLCSIHDRSFDTGLLRIGADYRLDVHPSVTEHAAEPSVATYLLSYTGATLTLPDRWHPDPVLLTRRSATRT